MSYNSQLGYTILGTPNYTSMPSPDVKPVIDPRVEQAGTRSEPASFWDKYFGWAGFGKETTENAWNELHPEGPQYTDQANFPKAENGRQTETVLLLAAMAGLVYALIKLKRGS